MRKHMRLEVPLLGIEPRTFSLQERCSTTEPERHVSALEKPIPTKLLVGVEPTIFRLRPQDIPMVEGGRAIHYATGAWGG